MSHQQIIEEVQQLLVRLPEQQVLSVRDFAAFLAGKNKPVTDNNTPAQATETDEELNADIMAVIRHSKAYDFLYDEPDLYTDDDLIERYK